MQEHSEKNQLPPIWLRSAPTITSSNCRAVGMGLRVPWGCVIMLSSLSDAVSAMHQSLRHGRAPSSRRLGTNARTHFGDRRSLGAETEPRPKGWVVDGPVQPVLRRARPRTISLPLHHLSRKRSPMPYTDPSVPRSRATARAVLRQRPATLMRRTAADVAASRAGRSNLSTPTP